MTTLALNLHSPSPMTNQIQPLYDQVLVTVAPQGTTEVTTSSGIVLVKTANPHSRQNLKRGTVTAVGAGEILYNGEIRPLGIKLGDTVLFAESDGLLLENTQSAEDPELFFIGERFIKGVIR